MHNIYPFNHFLFAFPYKNFYWSTTALQCCVSFHCTTKWISHTYSYIPPILSLSPTDPSPTSRLSQSIGLSLCATQQLSTSCGKLHMVVYIHVIANLPIHPTVPHVHTSVLYVCVSISALQTLTFYSTTVRSIATT